ncbi:MAG: GGDEF domain-containing protein [Spirochaetales bacterium]|nr:GGDEF domain-containing protein [Spirochaetales bacterium]
MIRQNENDTLFPPDCKVNYALTNEINRKRFMQLSMTTSGILVLFIMGILALIKGETMLFISDILFALSLSFLLYRIRKTQKIDSTVTLTLILIMLFYLYLFLTWKADGWSFFWFYTYPIVALFMVGGKKGLLLSLIFLAITLISYPTLFSLKFIPAYPKGVFLRVILSYLMVTFLTFVFEKTRHESQTLLEETLVELREKAIRDGLTGLYNRRYLDEVWALIKRNLNESIRKVTFIMIDIDFFKNYNDTYGHQMGDDVLRKIGTVLLELKRRKTDYAFRYGGEEFCLLLYDGDEKTSVRICETIKNTIYDMNIPHKKSPMGRVTASLGAIMCSIDKDVVPHKIIKKADDALYKAKQNGRNRLIFEKDIKKEIPKDPFFSDTTSS